MTLPKECFSEMLSKETETCINVWILDGNKRGVYSGMCKCLKLLCESKLASALCGKMTSNGLVSGKVSFYPGKDKRKKNTATLGAFNWQGYNKPSFFKSHKSTRVDCTFQINTTVRRSRCSMWRIWGSEIGRRSTM